MLIPVIYPNGTHDLVKDFYLDYLISSGRIDQFKRSSGWTSITSAKVRCKPAGKRYFGPERRLALREEEGEADNTQMN